MQSCHNNMCAITPVFLHNRRKGISRTIQSNLEIEEIGDLDWITEITPTKYARNRAGGRDLDIDRLL